MTDPRHQKRKAFHGPILRQISEQAWVLHPTIPGRQVRYSKAAWKELFRDWFIPPVPQERTVKATGEVKVVMVKRSTEDLSDAEFQIFITKVEAMACTELGVEFDQQEEEIS